MRLLALGLGAVLLGACARGSGVGSVEVPKADAGPSDGGAVDAGSPADAGGDAGQDAGAVDSGTPDAGIDAGIDGGIDAGIDGGIDAGTDGGIDAGTDGGVDAGTDGGTDAGTITFGGPGPWPLQKVTTYGQNDGIQETPIVGMSTDETQNLWVATHAAVYLRRPHDAKFTRFDVQSGLHMAGRNTIYCDRDYALDPEGAAAGLPPPDKACPITGAADSQGISEIVGGGSNEVFVGYFGTFDYNDPNDGSWADKHRHSGMLDRLRFTVDGSGAVVPHADRLQMVSGNSPAFWHNRTVMRLVFDHFKHPHELYVGTNHGVDRMTPDKFTPPVVRQGYPGEETYPSDTFAWMSDHLHPQACSCGPCSDTSEAGLLLGDWRGLAVTANGNLLVGGRWAAGKIIWVAPNATPNHQGWFERGGNSYEFSMGDKYYGNCSGSRPVWCVAKEGDTIAISAVTETPDGLQWFASGPYGYQPGNQACNAGDKDLGIASYDPKAYQFTYYTAADVGLPDTNVRDMMALPDGRIVFASHKNGLVIWNPKTKVSVPLNAANGSLPDDAVERLELDLMVAPPVLHVSTNSGATSIRVTR